MIEREKERKVPGTRIVVNTAKDHARYLDGRSYGDILSMTSDEVEAFGDSYFVDHDKKILSNCFYFNGNYSDQELDRFVLNKDMLMSFISGKKDEFVEARNKAIVDCERELLKEQGIIIKESQQDVS